MKVGVMLNLPSPPPLALNRQPQEGQGTWGHGGQDRMMDTGKASNGCGGRGGMKANGPREDEGTS